MVSVVSRCCIGFIAVVISGCATQQIPAWVEGKSDYYTNDAYLLGHGIGQNESVAEDNASRKITQQFKSISESKELSSQASIIFNLIKFENTWLNTSTDKFHVLAYISRNEAASFIRNKMLALDELTYQFFEQAKGTNDLLEQTSYIDSAINAQTRRIKFRPVLKIISTDSEITSTYNIVRLSKIRDQLQARINLQVDITEDKLGELDSIIKNSLDNAGFIRNVNSPSKNSLLVELKIEKTKIPETSGEFLMQGVLITSLQHKGDAAIRGHHKWTFSVTAKDQKLLVQKSRDILAMQLNADLKRIIMSMMVIEIDSEEDIPNQDYVDFDMPEFNSTEYNDIDKTPQAKSKSTSDIKTNSAVPSTTVKKKSVEEQTKQTQDIYAEPETTTSKTQDPATSPEVTKSPVATETKSPEKSPEIPTVTDNEDPISTLPELAN